MQNIDDKILIEQMLDFKATSDRNQMLRNVEIYVARYAYDMTYANIAAEFNLSTERVRQIICRIQRLLNARAKFMK